MVVVAANGMDAPAADRRPQRIENRRIGDVAGVQDDVGRRELSFDPLEQPIGVAHSEMGVGEQQDVRRADQLAPSMIVGPVTFLRCAGSSVTTDAQRKVRAMSVMMLRAKVKQEHVADVESAARTMFAAIERAQPKGVRYASCRLADGVTFVALLALEDGIENPLPSVPEFGAFQAGLKEWLAEPPVPEPLTVVGSYDLF
jgi:hypothetical protein